MPSSLRDNGMNIIGAGSASKNYIENRIPSGGAGVANRGGPPQHLQ